jgi:hypothetical protein
MAKILSAPVSTHGFQPYAEVFPFHNIYNKMHGGRPANRFSLETERPFVLGGQEDLDPHQLSRMERHLLLQIIGKPVYFLAHHGLATYACAEAVEFRALTKGATLFRFGAPDDLERGLLDPAGVYDLPEIYRNCQSEFNDCRYIWNLAGLGLISEIVWFKSSLGIHFINGDGQAFRDAFPGIKISSFDEHELAGFDRGKITDLLEKNIILDIDYNYFKGLRNEYLFSTADLIRFLFRRAGVVVQTLSPEFFRQDSLYPTHLAIDLMTSL